LFSLFDSKHALVLGKEHNGKKSVHRDQVDLEQTREIGEPKIKVPRHPQNPVVGGFVEKVGQHVDESAAQNGQI